MDIPGVNFNNNKLTLLLLIALLLLISGCMNRNSLPSSKIESSSHTDEVSVLSNNNSSSLNSDEASILSNNNSSAKPNSTEYLDQPKDILGNPNSIKLKIDDLEYVFMPDSSEFAKIMNILSSCFGNNLSMSFLDMQKTEKEFKDSINYIELNYNEAQDYAFIYKEFNNRYVFKSIIVCLSGDDYREDIITIYDGSMTFYRQIKPIDLNDVI